MNLSICNIDSSLFVNSTTVPWAVQAIDNFCKEVSESDLKNSGLTSFASALAYYARNVYDKNGDTTTVYNFDKNCIMPGVRDQIQGTENINTFSSWCRISGLLYDQRGIFGLSEIANYLLKPQRITISEFAFILLAKQWIRVNRECFRPLLSIIDILTDDDGTFIQLLRSYTQSRKDISKQLQSCFFKAAVGRDLTSNDSVSFNRFDTLRNCLVQAGILTDRSSGFNLTSEGKRILTDYHENESRIKAFSTNPVDFYEYMCSIANGAFSLIDGNNVSVYKSLYPNLAKIALSYDSQEYNTIPSSLPLAPRQRIFFGAPGTGKSYKIKKLTKNESVIRTTFHPDSDYSSFVGAYKPTMKRVHVRDSSGGIVKEGDEVVNEDRIVYEFSEQAFLQAYINAWKLLAESDEAGLIRKQYLIIEEINRGNCAQIFGDIFQLLDRNKRGFSDYPVTADHDIQEHLKKAFSSVPSFPNYINSFYPEQLGDVSERIHSGEILVLPCNLYIWATMNTSDQSLFPMDSAFKRRWEQEFVKIDYSDASNFILRIGEESFCWGNVLHALNRFIEETEHSAHKLLGNRFVQTRFGSIIDYASFRDKVIFYLFNDVFKDDDSFAAKFFAGRKGYLFFEDLYENDDVQISIDFIKGLLAEDSGYNATHESTDDLDPGEEGDSYELETNENVADDTTTQDVDDSSHEDEP